MTTVQQSHKSALEKLHIQALEVGRRLWRHDEFHMYGFECGEPVECGDHVIPLDPLMRAPERENGRRDHIHRSRDDVQVEVDERRMVTIQRRQDRYCAAPFPVEGLDELTSLSKVGIGAWCWEEVHP